MKINHCAVVTALLTIATAANATVYAGNRSVGSTSISLSVTTDGTLGTLQRSNIIDWNIVATALNPVNNFVLTPANSVFESPGSALQASASELTFDFDHPNQSYFLFYAFPIVENVGTRFYCADSFNTKRCNRGAEFHPSESVYDDNLSVVYENRTGIGLLGSAVVVGVPEPASWALMIVGFGMAGAAMRRLPAAITA